LVDWAHGLPFGEFPTSYELFVIYFVDLTDGPQFVCLTCPNFWSVLFHGSTNVMFWWSMT